MTAVDRENPFAGQGSVLLDIGGDIGALVVTMPASMVGEEVEIRPAGHGRTVHRHDDHGHHSHLEHVAVVDRPVAGGSLPSLVFAELVEGTYELCEKGTDDVRMVVAVTGGQVTEARWETCRR